MNQLKSKRELLETDFTAALDRTVEAAFALRLSESDLVTLIHRRFLPQTSSNVYALSAKTPKNMYDSLAGP